MRLRLSKLAIEDITLIHDYTVGEWGEEQAVKYVHALWDALEEVAAYGNVGGTLAVAARHL